MPRRKITTKIEDNKVIFSQEVLEYYKNIRTEENSEWIDKYFKVLSDEENLITEKYNCHHIIPCFVFKDEAHKTREETESLADKIEGNTIKLSIYNHLLAHHCLWKIYNNKDSKSAFQKMCGWEKAIEDLSENELDKIALIKEECAKKNQTDEERKEYLKQYEKDNAERIKKYRENRKEEQKAYMKLWLEEHKEEQKEKRKNIMKKIKMK